MQRLETRAARGGCGEVRSRLAGWTLLVAMVLAPSLVSAQGMFYREVVKDGRIYVFNNMEAFAQFEKSGEASKSITRIGFGPNGETVVFDSEEAINAYLFKQGKPGEVIIKPPEKKPKMSVTWKDGKTFVETDFSSFSLSNRVQFRFLSINPEAEGVDTDNSFQVRRFETRVEGWFFTPKLSADLEMSWRDSRLINDIDLNYDFQGTKQIMVKAGQFRVPFGRQEMTSSMSLQFTDRSIASTDFAQGRDIGVQIWGEVMNRKIEYRAGIFNGALSGAGVGGNDNTKFQYTARVMWQPFGDVRYSESDFETNSNTPLLLEVAAEYDNNDRREATPAEDFKREHFGFDAVLKTRGLFAFADYYTGKRTGETVDEFNVNGLTLQAGFQIIRYKFELGGRYSSVDPDTDVDDNTRSEIGAFAAYYWNKHPLKIVADYREVKDDSKAEGEQKIGEFRTTLQFLF